MGPGGPQTSKKNISQSAAPEIFNPQKYAKGAHVRQFFQIFSEENDNETHQEHPFPPQRNVKSIFFAFGGDPQWTGGGPGRSTTLRKSTVAPQIHQNNKM